MLTHADIGTVADYLRTEGAKPENEFRLVRYQELFHPKFNVPDWREYRGQRYDDYIASKQHPEADSSSELESSDTAA